MLKRLLENAQKADGSSKTFTSPADRERFNPSPSAAALEKVRRLDASTRSAPARLGGLQLD